MKIFMVMVMAVILVIWGISFGQFQATKIYDNGLVAGKVMGFQEGYKVCWVQMGMQWIDSHQRFLGFTNQYGNIHNTPWDKFTIEEKTVIAMYGGSGSKLNENEIKEFEAKYERKK